MDTTATARIDDPGAHRPAGALTIIAGRYEVDLDTPLGSGGMAMVYRGRDLRTRRPVAMRTLRVEYRRDPAIRARFRHETRLQAFASHPNIARVFDLHEEGDAPWAVHEFVPGTSLADLLEQHGPFAPHDIANVLDQLGAALSHLHQGGVVHLDVTPRNVLMTDDGLLKLIDFGLAQSAGTVQESIGGSTFGTAAYLAPEQATGEPVGPATDVYALGCVVYELLTGTPPFMSADGDGRQREVINAHLREEPRPPSRALPHGKALETLDDVVLWALAKDPGERYQRADAFARMFRAAVEGTTAGNSATTTPVALIDVPAYRPPRSPHIVPKQDAPERVEWFSEEPARQTGFGRGVGKGVYRLGGRVVQRMGWMRRLIWRLTVLLLVANVLLAAGIVLVQGPEGLLARTPALRMGGTANVVEDDYTIRATAGRNASPITTVSSGERLVLTGEPVLADGLRWWPVEFDEHGQTRDGFIAENGIEPVTEGIGDKLLRSAERRFDELRSDAETWLTGE